MGQQGMKEINGEIINSHSTAARFLDMEETVTLDETFNSSFDDDDECSSTLMGSATHFEYYFNKRRRRSLEEEHNFLFRSDPDTHWRHVLALEQTAATDRICAMVLEMHDEVERMIPWWQSCLQAVLHSLWWFLQLRFPVGVYLMILVYWRMVSMSSTTRTDDYANSDDL